VKTSNLSIKEKLKKILDTVASHQKRAINNSVEFNLFRIALSCLCAMDFRNFPMDRQTCELNFLSCKYVRINNSLLKTY